MDSIKSYELKMHSTYKPCRLENKGEIYFNLCHVDFNDQIKIPEPLFILKMDREAVQKLMNDLWECGYKPDQFKDMFINLINKLGQP